MGLQQEPEVKHTKSDIREGPRWEEPECINMYKTVTE